MMGSARAGTEGRPDVLDATGDSLHRRGNPEPLFLKAAGHVSSQSWMTTGLSSLDRYAS